MAVLSPHLYFYLGQNCRFKFRATSNKYIKTHLTLYRTTHRAVLKRDPLNPLFIFPLHLELSLLCSFHDSGYSSRQCKIELPTVTLKAAVFHKLVFFGSEYDVRNDECIKRFVETDNEPETRWH